MLFFRKWVQAIHYLYLLQFLQDTHKDSQADDTYMSTILATSPPLDILTTIPVVPRLHAKPQVMPARVRSLSKVLVSPPQQLQRSGVFVVADNSEIFMGIVC